MRGRGPLTLHKCLNGPKSGKPYWGASSQADNHLTEPSEARAREEGCSTRPEDATQALSPLGHHLSLFTTTGPDRKLSKALCKPLQWDFLAGLREPRPVLQGNRFQEKLWPGVPATSTLDPALAWDGKEGQGWLGSLWKPESNPFSVMVQPSAPMPQSPACPLYTGPRLHPP